MGAQAQITQDNVIITLTISRGGNAPDDLREHFSRHFRIDFSGMTAQQQVDAVAQAIWKSLIVEPVREARRQRGYEQVDASVDVSDLGE